MAEIDGILASSMPAMRVHDNERIRYAVIENGVVVNMIIGPVGYMMEGKTLLAVTETSPIDIGWFESNGEFIPPPY